MQQLAAIRAQAEAHHSYFGLPGLTLALATPDGFATVENFGFANADARTPIAPDTLFQIGSISKSMAATVIHQMAAEGRLGLDQRVSDIAAGHSASGREHRLRYSICSITLRDWPTARRSSPPGGLWAAYAPAAHWHYSNTGYEILGKIAEHAGGKPLAQLLKERIFVPLGMGRTRGAIIGADRTLYAQGYEAADQSAVFARGVPLAPAAWVDVTFGAGSVASTGTT